MSAGSPVRRDGEVDERGPVGGQSPTPSTAPAPSSVAPVKTHPGPAPANVLTELSRNPDDSLEGLARTAKGGIPALRSNTLRAMFRAATFCARRSLIQRSFVQLYFCPTIPYPTLQRRQPTGWPRPAAGSPTIAPLPQQTRGRQPTPTGRPRHRPNPGLPAKYRPEPEFQHRDRPDCPPWGSISWKPSPWHTTTDPAKALPTAPAPRSSKSRAAGCESTGGHSAAAIPEIPTYSLHPGEECLNFHGYFGPHA